MRFVVWFSKEGLPPDKQKAIPQNIGHFKINTGGHDLIQNFFSATPHILYHPGIAQI